MLLDSLAHGGNDRTLSCVTLPRDLFSVEDIPILQMSQMLELQWHCAVAEGTIEPVANCLQDPDLGDWRSGESDFEMRF